MVGFHFYFLLYELFLLSNVKRWYECCVVRFVGHPGLHQLQVCRGKDPLYPTSETSEGVVVSLTDTNHLAFPVKSARPPLRIVHLPAPLLHLGKRREELRHMRTLLTSKVSYCFVVVLVGCDDGRRVLVLFMW